MNWSKLQKWDALKATIKCRQKKGYGVFLVNQNQQKTKRTVIILIKKIREDFNKMRDRFLKPKIKEIKKNLYEIENKKIFLNQK